MKSPKEKFLDLVSGEKTESLERSKARIEKRAMLRASQDIAIKILEKLDELGWSQKDLAKILEVSPQYISKLLKGKENLTLETLVSLQTVLDIPILADYYEQEREESKRFVGQDEVAIIVETSIYLDYHLYSLLEFTAATKNANPYQLAG